MINIKIVSSIFKGLTRNNISLSYRAIIRGRSCKLDRRYLLSEEKSSGINFGVMYISF